MKINERKPKTKKGGIVMNMIDRLFNAMFGPPAKQQLQVTVKVVGDGEVVVGTHNVPTRPFIDGVYSKYVIVSLNNSDLVNGVIKGDKDLMSRIATDDVIKVLGKKFYASFGVIRDDKATIVLLPGEGKWMDGLDALGIKIKNKPGGAGKAMKYLKRLLAPHAHTPDIAPKVLVKKPIGKMTDGFGLMSLAYARYMDPKAKPGTLYQYTYVDGEKFCKGFAVVVKKLNTDLITYEHKDEVTFHDNDMLGNSLTWFGALGKAKGKDSLYTDLQTATNFELESFVHDWSERYLEPLMANYDNVDYLRSLMGLHSPKAEDMGWLLADALKHLKNPLSYPGLVNRVMRYFVDGTLMDAKKLRVPAVDAVARYLTCDPTCFDANGDFYPDRGVLKPGEVFIGSEITGNVSMVRSPNAEGEKHHAVAKYPVELAKLEGNALFYSGHDVKAAENMHEVLGGSDNDDRICIYYGRADKHLRSLPTLDMSDRCVAETGDPLAKQIEALGFDISTFPKAARDIIANPRWEAFNAHTFEILRAKMGKGGNIGSAVNKLWLGAIIKHNLPKFLDVITKRDGKEVAERAKAALPDFWGKDLELVIDTMINSATNDGAKALVAEIKSIEDWITDYKVVPDLAIGSLVKKSRVPGKIVARATGEKPDIAIVKTGLGDVQDKIMIMVNALRMKYGALMVASDWSLAPMDVAVPAYLKDHAGQMRSTWVTMWSLADTDNLSDDEFNVLYKSHCHAINLMLHALPTEEERYLVVAELYRMIYVRELSEDDTKLMLLGMKSFPDGILWACDTGDGRVRGIGRYTITMLQLAGEGRALVDVMFTAGNERLEREALTCTVASNAVYRGKDCVGLVLGVPNNTYRLEYGKLVVEGDFNHLVKCKGRAAFTIVDGWMKDINSGIRTEANLEAWKEMLIDQELVLKPCVDKKGNPAVKALLDGNEVGWVAKSEIGLIKRAIKVVVSEARSKFILFATAQTK